MPHRILVIEDNHDIARLVELHLKDLSYQVDLDSHGRTGLQRAMNGNYDLMILDIMLPDLMVLRFAAGCGALRTTHRY